MIERTHPKLSVGAQCQLLSIARSSFYYAPQGETALNLDLMRNAGAVIYINGIEVARSNMPTGPIGPGTYAGTPPVTADRNSAACCSFFLCCSIRWHPAPQNGQILTEPYVFGHSLQKTLAQVSQTKNAVDDGCIEQFFGSSCGATASGGTSNTF